jgi:hypothetical protein
MIVAWGDNNYGECDVPSSLSGKTVTAITSGTYHNLALTSGGTIVAWGYNSSGQCNIPTSLAGKTVMAIAAGTRHSLALTSQGTVVAWGDNSLGQCNIPASLAGKTVTAIVAGTHHNLALTSGGSVIAWGDNRFGECNIPNSLSGKTVTSISAGWYNSFAVASDGTVVAWGNNDSGQSNIPTNVLTKTVIVIAGGSSHSLCIATPARPAFTVSRATFVGGTASVVSGAITFETPVTDDESIELSSDDPSVTVPPSIEIRAGSSTASFRLSSIPVSAPRRVILTAKTHGFLDATKVITVVPQIALVTANPSNFQGGTVGTGKVTLWVPSATDTVVALTSSNSLVDFLGAVVKIPAKQRSASFKIPSKEVAKDTNLDILAKPGISEQVGIATITLTPAPKIQTFTAPRRTIYGNRKTTFKIKLAKGPGPSGTTVKLEANGAGLSMPSSVFFPAGKTLQSFDVWADENATTGSVRITATSGLSSAVGIVISVNQLKVTGSTHSAGSVTGGVSVNVTVNLNAAVDKDTEITVASSDPAVASVPTSVKVPAGAKTVTYTLTTYAVTGRKTVTITAAKGGYTSTKALTVIP